jgi:hypothetical protein
MMYRTKVLTSMCVSHYQQVDGDVLTASLGWRMRPALRSSVDSWGVLGGFETTLRRLGMQPEDSENYTQMTPDADLKRLNESPLLDRRSLCGAHAWHAKSAESGDQGQCPPPRELITSRFGNTSARIRLMPITISVAHP